MKYSERLKKIVMSCKIIFSDIGMNWEKEDENKSKDEGKDKDLGQHKFSIRAKYSSHLYYLNKIIHHRLK